MNSIVHHVRCYEIMYVCSIAELKASLINRAGSACPYVLRADRCGHSFCAVCILKWYFTQLHRDCGSWHDPLQCPLCRTELPDVPADPPRPGFTCPFAPNRLADEAITAALQALQSILTPAEDMTDIDTSDSMSGKGKATAKKNSITLTPLLQDDEQSLGWRKNGPLWTEWQNRDRYVRALVSCTTTYLLTTQQPRKTEDELPHLALEQYDATGIHRIPRRLGNISNYQRARPAEQYEDRSCRTTFPLFLFF